MELYVHIPFCRQKCSYCDFLSFSEPEAVHEAYVRSLLEEARNKNIYFGHPLISTVYIGGGTPSVLKPSLLRGLLYGLRSVFSISPDAEFSIEANPCSFSAAFLETCLENGVNRFSLGMQSADPEELSMLGRIHRCSDVENAVSLLQKHHIANYNLDLMFGLPGQTLSGWRNTVSTALSYKPAHLSCYGLIPEPDTPMKKKIDEGTLVLPEVESEREMYYEAVRELGSHGLRQYEISNFSLTGMHCRHNIGYWRQEEYIGLGLGAASMYGAHRNENGLSYIRAKNISNLHQYMHCNGQIPYEETEYISPEESRFETLMLGLRMNDGVSVSAYKAMHNIDITETYGNKLTLLRDEGYLTYDDDSVRLTEKGMDLQNYVLVELMA